MPKIINIFDKLWLQKQSYCYVDMNNCSFVGAVNAILVYRRHLKIIVSSVHKPLNTIITSSNPNSYISESLFERAICECTCSGMHEPHHL